MSEAERISVEEARRRTTAGDALLVCAYDDEDKCATMKLEGAITLDQLETKLSPEDDKDLEIIFYCG